MKKCSYCGEENPNKNKFCLHCGKEIEQEKIDFKHTIYEAKQCIKCGHSNYKEDAYCLKCGHKLDYGQTQKEQVSKESLETKKSLKCSKCKEILNQDDYFCLNCGNKVKEDDDSKSFKTINRNKAKSIRNTKPKSSKKLALLLIVLGFLVIVCLLYKQGIFDRIAESNLKDTNRQERIDIVKKSDPSENDFQPKRRKNRTDSSNEKTSSSQIKQSDESNEEVKQDDKVKTKNVVSKEAIETTFNHYFKDLSGSQSFYYQALSNKNKEIIESDAISANGDEQIRAAGLINVYVVLAFYDQVHEGKVKLDDTYQLKSNDYVGGTGSLSSNDVGLSFSYKDLARRSIIDNDNTATNILVEKIGGLSSVNAYIKKIGLNNTSMNRMLMDTEALESGTDNYLSANDLGITFAKLYKKELISNDYSQEILNLLKNRSDQKLARKLNNQTIYNLTGQFNQYGVVGDASIIETKEGAFVLVLTAESSNEDEINQAMEEFGYNINEVVIQANKKND